MKFFKTLTIFFFAFCFLHIINTSSAVTALSQPDNFSHEKDRLAQIFTIAVAREPIRVVLVEKNLQRLRVLEYDDDLKVIADFPVATGENSGIKEVSGDSKTPEGIYFITKIFKDDKVTIFGDRAFHLDYPNFFDRKKGRNGDGIYIHGTNKKLQPNSTNGCVTLAKNDLDQLEEYLNLMGTPVIIIPEIGSLEINTVLLTKNNFSLAKSLLLGNGIEPENVDFNNLYIISSGNQTVALSNFIYRPFKRSMMHGESRAYLQKSAAQGWTTGKKIWQATPLQIYPESPVKVAARPFVTGETTIAEHNPQDTAALVAALNSPVTPGKPTPDKVQNPARQVTAKPAQHELRKTEDKQTTLTEINKPEVAKVPVTRTALTPSRQKETEKKVAQKMIEVETPAIIFDRQQILDFVESWRKAWVSQQIEPYIAFYDKSFRSGNRNLAEWKKFKEIINKTYSYITVDISDIKVHRTADGARVSFRQKYLSDHYSSIGNKILYLVHNGSDWKIKSEFYSGI